MHSLSKNRKERYAEDADGDEKVGERKGVLERSEISDYSLKMHSIMASKLLCLCLKMALLNNITEITDLRKINGKDGKRPRKKMFYNVNNYSILLKPHLDFLRQIACATVETVEYWGVFQVTLE